MVFYKRISIIESHEDYYSSHKRVKNIFEINLTEIEEMAYTKSKFDIDGYTFKYLKWIKKQRKQEWI